MYAGQAGPDSCNYPVYTSPSKTTNTCHPASLSVSANFLFTTSIFFLPNNRILNKNTSFFNCIEALDHRGIRSPEESILSPRTLYLAEESLRTLYSEVGYHQSQDHPGPLHWNVIFWCLMQKSSIIRPVFRSGAENLSIHLEFQSSGFPPVCSLQVTQFVTNFFRHSVDAAALSSPRDRKIMKVTTTGHCARCIYSYILYVL